MNLSLKTDSILEDLNRIKEVLTKKNNDLIYSENYNKKVEIYTKNKMNYAFEVNNKRKESDCDVYQQKYEKFYCKQANDENLNLLQRPKIRIGLSRKRSKQLK